MTVIKNLDIKITFDHPKREETQCAHTDSFINEEREVLQCSRCGLPLRKLEKRIKASRKQ